MPETGLFGPNVGDRLFQLASAGEMNEERPSKTGLYARSVTREGWVEDAELRHKKGKAPLLQAQAEQITLASPARDRRFHNGGERLFLAAKAHAIQLVLVQPGIQRWFMKMRAGPPCKPSFLQHRA